MVDSGLPEDEMLWYFPAHYGTW